MTVLTYGECYLPGTTEDEILLSCHVCHPSLANDNLSGIAVMTFLAQYLQRCPALLLSFPLHPRDHRLHYLVGMQ